MLSPGQVAAIAKEARRQHKRHVSDLLHAVERIQGFEPQSRVSARQVYEVFLSDTHAAIIQFGESLIAEVIRIVRLVSNGLRSNEKQKIVEELQQFLEVDLYRKRQEIFEAALERRLKSFSLHLNPEAERFDLIRSRYQVGTANLIKEIRMRLSDELDLLVLAGSDANCEKFAELKLTDAVGLKPGIFGFNFDLRHAWSWWRSRKK